MLFIVGVENILIKMCLRNDGDIFITVQVLILTVGTQLAKTGFHFLMVLLPRLICMRPRRKCRTDLRGEYRKLFKLPCS